MIERSRMNCIELAELSIFAFKSSVNCLKTLHSLNCFGHIAVNWLDRAHAAFQRVQDSPVSHKTVRVNHVTYTLLHEFVVKDEEHEDVKMGKEDPEVPGVGAAEDAAEENWAGDHEGDWMIPNPLHDLKKVVRMGLKLMKDLFGRLAVVTPSHVQLLEIFQEKKKRIGPMTLCWRTD